MDMGILVRFIDISIGEANRAIAPLIQALNQREMAHLRKSRKQLFEELDQPALRPLPERPYEFATWKNAKVNIDYHIAFEGHYYSVPHTLVRQEVRIRATETILTIFHHGQLVTSHPRSLSQGRFFTRPEYMPANHRFVLTADADWFQKEAGKIDPSTTAYVSALLKSRQYPQQAYSLCLGILNLARHSMLILGPTGSGKTYLVSAFGVAAARNGYTVRYHRLSRLLHTLTLARQDGSLINLLRSLAKTKLLIFDDWMHDSITIQNAQDVLEILDNRSGHTSTLISSQVPVTDWHLRI